MGNIKMHSIQQKKTRLLGFTSILFILSVATLLITSLITSPQAHAAGATASKESPPSDIFAKGGKVKWLYYGYVRIENKRGNKFWDYVLDNEQARYVLQAAGTCKSGSTEIPNDIIKVNRAGGVTRNVVLAPTGTGKQYCRSISSTSATPVANTKSRKDALFYQIKGERDTIYWWNHKKTGETFQKQSTTPGEWSQVYYNNEVNNCPDALAKKGDDWVLFPMARWDDVKETYPFVEMAISQEYAEIAGEGSSETCRVYSPKIINTYETGRIDGDTLEPMKEYRVRTSDKHKSTDDDPITICGDGEDAKTRDLHIFEEPTWTGGHNPDKLIKDKAEKNGLGRDGDRGVAVEWFEGSSKPSGEDFWVLSCRRTDKIGGNEDWGHHTLEIWSAGKYNMTTKSNGRLLNLAHVGLWGRQGGGDAFNDGYRVANNIAIVDASEVSDAPPIIEDSPDNGGDEGGDGGGEEDTTSCALDGVGWLICPVAKFLGWVTDSLFTTVSTLLNVNSSMFNSGGDTYRAWSAVRNIANVLFVIAFMVVIYSQLTGGVLTNYGIKKMLPRIIVAAILVNISFWICALAVDISNILGKSLQDLFMNIIPSSNSDGGNNLSVWQDITGWILAGGGAALAVGGVTLAALSSGGFLAAAALALPMLVGVLTAILAAVLVLVARQAIIVILVVISPLAFVAYLLPNTESWFSKWRGTFATMLLLFPIISLIFGGSQLAAAIVRGSTDNALVYISSLGIQAIPLFITPMVLKFSGGLLSRFGGVVNNPNKGPMDRLRRGAEGVRDRTVTRSQNAAMNSTSSSKNPFKNRRPFKKAIQRQARKDAVARAQEQELNRAKTGYIADAAKSDSAFRSQLAAGGGAGADTRALANAINIEANLEADEVKAARAVIEEANLSNSEKAQLAAGGDPITKNGLVLNSAGDAGLQMRLAAQQATVATGDAKQINKMIDYASGKNATDGTDAKELNNMANALESSPNTPSYIQPANLETMRLNGTDSHKLGGADSLIKGALRDGVYSSADKLASTGRQEMGVVSEVAKTMASSPNKQDTDAVLALHEAAKTATTDSRIAPRLGKQKTVVENLASGDTSRW